MVILTVIGGLLLGLDMDAAAVQTASRVAVAGLPGAALAVPMALVSIWRRGYLPGFVALLALVVVPRPSLPTEPGPGSLRSASAVDGHAPVPRPRSWYGGTAWDGWEQQPRLLSLLPRTVSYDDVSHGLGCGVIA